MPLKLTQDNTTGLIWAAMAGNADVLNAFIEAGADIDAQEKAGGTALLALNQETTDTVTVVTERPYSADLGVQRGERARRRGIDQGWR
jgi:hypothetical protein